jgi:hypothetical protein
MFLVQPKAHRIKYAEKHCVIETDILKGQVFFEDSQAANDHSGKYKSVVKGKKKARNMQRLRREAVMTTKIMAQGNMTVMITMSTSPTMNNQHCSDDHNQMILVHQP